MSEKERVRGQQERARGTLGPPRSGGEVQGGLLLHRPEFIWREEDERARGPGSANLCGVRNGKPYFRIPWFS